MPVVRYRGRSGRQALCFDFSQRKARGDQSLWKGGQGHPRQKGGSVMTVAFEIEGLKFLALNGAPLQVHRGGLVPDPVRHSRGRRLLLEQARRTVAAKVNAAG